MIKDKNIYMFNFKKILYILIALFGLTLIISIHEFGHFLACKIFKVNTPTFSVGIDPAIISKKFKSTTFQIGALPIGGYVSIDQNDFAKLPYLQQLLIMIAGILFNILFAAAVFLFLHVRKTERIEINQDENPEFLEFKDLLKKDNRKLIGPFGIIGLIEKSVSHGIESFLYFLALISINIAFFNLLPIPFFDGGQILSITLKQLAIT